LVAIALVLVTAGVAAADVIGRVLGKISWLELCPSAWHAAREIPAQIRVGKLVLNFTAGPLAN
jgi:hypothetical protein